MFHVCIAHCMPKKIHKMSKFENSCFFVWSTVGVLSMALVLWLPVKYKLFIGLKHAIMPS